MNQDPRTGNASAPAATVRRPRWKTFALIGLVAGATTLASCGFRAGGWHHGDEPGEKLGYMVDKVFSRVDATDAQKARLQTIATAAWSDLAPLRTQLRDGRQKALELLGAAQIDRAGIEALRLEQAALLDNASRRVTSALTDMAEVLTPEQRAQMRERIAERMDKRRGWHRG
ncbi:MAG: Spy/CpxP family protein refolding chaperone [Burkholderiaceae bacterium]